MQKHKNKRLSVCVMGKKDDPLLLVKPPVYSCFVSTDCSPDCGTVSELSPVEEFDSSLGDGSDCEDCSDG